MKDGVSANLPPRKSRHSPPCAPGHSASPPSSSSIFQHKKRYLACLSAFSFGWRNSCSRGHFTNGKWAIYRWVGRACARKAQKCHRMGGCGCRYRHTLTRCICQAKRFTQSQSLPWDESKRERSEKIAFKAKLNPSNEKPNDRTRTNEKQKKIDN